MGMALMEWHDWALEDTLAKTWLGNRVKDVLYLLVF